MLRREALALLWAGATRAGLDRFFGSGLGSTILRGTALLVSVPKRQLVAQHRAATAGSTLAPPGSLLKPFVLSALLDSGKLGPRDSFLCPGKLAIGNRNLSCVHPPLARPLGIADALAYSCNCFVAHFAQRFGPGELRSSLERMGLASRSGLLPTEVPGRIQPATDADATQLQSLGEWGVLLTAAGVAAAYRNLALVSIRAEMQPILEGLEGAVEFGTAQRARIPGLRVAGKTGSARAADGASIAWFAGFAPSRAPEVAVSVMLQGRSGGADAAPIAGRILEAWRAGRLA